MKEFCSFTEMSIVDDLMEYLERLGLRDFSGISLPPESLAEEFLLPSPVFYSDKLIHKKKKIFFDNLNLELSREEFIFYKGD